MRIKLKNIVIVDDHAIVNDAFKLLIEKLGPFIVSHQFDNAEKFVAAFPLKPIPDLIILDVFMPGLNGEEVMEKLNEMGLKIPVLVLSTCDEADIIINLFKLGIRGYKMKNCSASALKNAMNEIFRSGIYRNQFHPDFLPTNPNVKRKRTQNEKENDFRLFCVAGSSEKISIKISEIMYLKTTHIGRQTKSVILRNGSKYILRNCEFKDFIQSSPNLIRINKSELINLEIFDKIESDYITLKMNAEDGKPKHVTLNRWYKKDFFARLALRR